MSSGYFCCPSHAHLPTLNFRTAISRPTSRGHLRCDLLLLFEDRVNISAAMSGSKKYRRYGPLEEAKTRSIEVSQEGSHAATYLRGGDYGRRQGWFPTHLNMFWTQEHVQGRDSRKIRIPDSTNTPVPSHTSSRMASGVKLALSLTYGLLTVFSKRSYSGCCARLRNSSEARAVARHCPSWSLAAVPASSPAP